MKAISLVDAGLIYSCSDSAQFNYHAIQCHALKAFCVGLDQLEHALGELNEEEYWLTYLRQVRRYRFQICATPFSSDQQGKNSQELVLTLRYHLRHCSEIYSDRLARLAHAILDQADAFAQTNINPLLDAIAALCDDHNEIPRALLVKDSRLIPFAEAALATREAIRKIVYEGWA